MLKLIKVFKILLVFILILVSKYSYCSNEASLIQWKLYKFEGCRFSIESPFEVETVKVPNKSQLIFRADPMSSKFRIFGIVDSILFDGSRVPKIELKDTPYFMISIVQKSNTPCSNFKLVNKSLSWRGNPAVFTVGTYKDFKGFTKKVKMLNIKRGVSWCEVSVNYDPQDKEQEQMANRVLESVKY